MAEQYYTNNLGIASYLVDKGYKYSMQKTANKNNQVTFIFYNVKNDDIGEAIKSKEREIIKIYQFLLKEVYKFLGNEKQ